MGDGPGRPGLTVIATGLGVSCILAIRYVAGRDRPDPTCHPEARSMTALPSTTAGGPRTTFSPEEAEHFYRPLGAWKGPLASREVQKEAFDFWRSSGEEGVRWLVARLRDEHYIETIHAAASLLGDLGEIVLDPLFEELSRGAAGDQVICLLWALDSLSESEPTLQLEDARAELALADLLQSDDPDLREAAAGAMRVLKTERAVRWLEHRMRDEANPEVRKAIEAELAWHRAGRS
jgi:hypothetical protein